MKTVRILIVLFLLLNGCSSTMTWKDATKLNTSAAFARFIQDFPQDPMIPEARKKIEALDFQQATKINSEESYQNFLKNYPESEFKESALRKMCEAGVREAGSDMDKLDAFKDRHASILWDSEAKAIFDKAIMDAGEKAFKDAEASGESMQVDSFLKRFGHHPRKEEAQKAYATLRAKEEAAAFESAQKKDTFEEWDAYLAEYEESPHRDVAQKTFSRFTWTKLTSPRLLSWSEIGIPPPISGNIDGRMMCLPYTQYRYTGSADGTYMLSCEKNIIVCEENSFMDIGDKQFPAKAYTIVVKPTMIYGGKTEAIFRCESQSRMTWMSGGNEFPVSAWLVKGENLFVNTSENTDQIVLPVGTTINLSGALFADFGNNPCASVKPMRAVIKIKGGFIGNTYKIDIKKRNGFAFFGRILRNATVIVRNEGFEIQPGAEILDNPDAPAVGSVSQ